MTFKNSKRPRHTKKVMGKYNKAAMNPRFKTWDEFLAARWDEFRPYYVKWEGHYR